MATFFRVQVKVSSAKYWFMMNMMMITEYAVYLSWIICRSSPVVQSTPDMNLNHTSQEMNAPSSDDVLQPNPSDYKLIDSPPDNEPPLCDNIQAFPHGNQKKSHLNSKT